MPSSSGCADYDLGVTQGASASRKPTNVALLAVGRFGALLVIIVIAGLLLGLGIGYPLSKVQLNVRSAESLDQVALAGQFDPALALVQQGDLPGNFTESPDNLAPFGLLGSSVCGDTPVVSAPLGEKLQKAFTTGADGQVVVSEVQRVRRPLDANNYVRDLARAFDNCTGGTFYRGTGADRVAVHIKPGQPNPPVSDYVSYTLVPDKSGKTQEFVVFQVGDVIVSAQFIGPTRPPVKLLDKVQLSILARTAPAVFGTTKGVNGVRPLPVEVTTTTVLPPTSSIPPPTTTIAKKKRAATTVAPATAPPPTAAPGQ